MQVLPLAKRHATQGVVVAAFVAASTLIAFGSQDRTWYHTKPIDVSLVEQKRATPIDAARALKIFDTSEDRIAADWRTHLPGEPAPAERVDKMPEGGIIRHEKERRPLKIHILGFSENKVRVVLARHVGNHLWHWYHAVETDLLIDRSRDVDGILDLGSFIQPFLRTIRGIGHGVSRDKVHETLGPPDAHRFTQSMMLSWDYYFDEGITIEYQGIVFKITDHVPEPIRDRTTTNPMVRYREVDKAVRH